MQIQFRTQCNQMVQAFQNKAAAGYQQAKIGCLKMVDRLDATVKTVENSTIVPIGNWIHEIFKDINSFIAQNIMPIYKRKIGPMTKLDGFIIGTGVTTAMIVMYLAWSVFNPAYFALATVAGLSLFIGSISISLYRVNRHFDSIAWDYVDVMRRKTLEMVKGQNNFAAISQERAKLEAPEYSHLEEDMKKFDEALRQFRNAANNTNVTQREYDDAKKAFADFLKGLQTKLDSSKTIEAPPAP